LKVGADIVPFDPHSVETITATGRTKETFAYSTGFGMQTISGFDVAGTGHDTVDFSLSMFGLTAGMTQAQDFAAMLMHAATNGANTIVTDNHTGDSLTFDGISKATLAANGGDFKFG
jgi:hypothetical protein